MAHIEENKLIVLGEKYIAKPKSQSKSQSKSILPKLIQMAAGLASIYPIHNPYYNKPRKRPAVNLIEEYELIQQKKSKLSKSDRDWVEDQFHKNFIKVEGLKK